MHDENQSCLFVSIESAWAWDTRCMSSFFFFAEDGAESSVRTGSVVEDGAQHFCSNLAEDGVLPEG